MQSFQSYEPLRTRSHARTVHLADHTPDELCVRLRHGLDRAGFFVLTQIDMADVLRGRVDIGLAPHYLLDVCRPDLLGRALAVAPDASLLLPCRLSIWAEGSGATVGLVPPTRLLTALGREHLEAVAAETEESLGEIFGDLLRPKHQFTLVSKNGDRP